MGYISNRKFSNNKCSPVLPITTLTYAIDIVITLYVFVFV